MIYIFIALILFLGFLFYWKVIRYDQKLKAKLRQSDMPKDINDAQDHDFCKIAAVINSCKTEDHIIACAKSIGLFEIKYGGKITGQHDTRYLFQLLEKQNDELYQRGALTGL